MSSLNLSDLNGSNGFVINGIDFDDQSGFSVSSAGDVNGDGFDDLLIGAFGGDPNGVSDAGESYVVFGKSGGFSSSLNLSDLNGSNGFVINGIDNIDFSARSVSSAGDVNGDGFDDLLIGAFGGDPNGQFNAGESYVVFGKSGGFSSSLNLADLNGSNGFVINGIDGGDFSGRSVSSAGDVNGDGFDDLLIGAYFADPNGQSNAGESYVVFGKSGGFSSSLNLADLNGSNGFVINGIDLADYSGRSVSSAGDVNGDGFDDFLIGANRADPNGQFNAGESYVVFGKSGGFSSSLNLADLNGSNGFVINGIDGSDASGRSVSSAGDINGDGFDDLLIGAYFADPNGVSNAGESYVVFGKSGGFSSSLNLSDLNGSNGFVINGIDNSDYSGFSVSSAGDVNGDGFDDLLIGAVFADPNGVSNAGESYVVFGKSGGFSSSLNLSDLNGSNGFVINGIDSNDYSGLSVSSAGDVNGDGFDDLLIGAYRADPNGVSNAGESYVVFGSADIGASDIDNSAPVLDLNGAQLFNGFVINGIDSRDDSGYSVSSAGDVNGDGFDDLLIGAFGGDPNGQSYAGESYVVFGKSGGFSSSLNLADLNGSNGFVINGIDLSDDSGYSVSSAGDVNGDGFDDLLIGASGGDPNGVSNAGESYVVFGSADIGASGIIELTSDPLFVKDFSAVFQSGAAPVAIVSPGLTLSDANSATLAGATITISNLLDGTDEVLSATATGPITVSYSNGVLTLAGNGTVAEYEQVLRTVTYNNTSPNIDTTDRLITFVVDDGKTFQNLSQVVTTTLRILSNKAPTITSAPTASFNENDTGVVYTVTANDPEGATLTYSLGGIDGALFTIDSKTGQVTFLAPPDFEDSNDDVTMATMFTTSLSRLTMDS
ncbi:FG-GAP repeat protein [Synechocystis sp. LEGE 06083]|uniref:beta strand repeat-containing protein n=1 Tax=Synechocystis sp. LEGE 06083 TaxID=915336 RepID=UPI001881C059|nr:integrin alpha [Synechocystis sp. LEGE 06083]MBE9196860.1 FG-GAP repeat protein [Synechocystis sp. LEGE 06083]